MKDYFEQEKFLAEIINYLVEVFGKQVILKGGMVLRLLGSNRYTNDADFVFVPYHSKKDIVKKILESLQAFPEIKISHSMNSKCLRINLERNNIHIQLEINVAKELHSITQSTSLLSSKYSLPPRMILVMAPELALAHKMAAWNERRLIRDIFDIAFWLRLGITPDKETLSARLTKPEYSKKVKQKNYFRGNDIKSFYTFIMDKVSQLTDEAIRNELSAYLNENEIPGLKLQFLSALQRLI